MNPHIVIDTALESFEESDGSVGVQLWAERIITKAFHEKLITLEERDHYNGRLTRIVGRRARKAA